MRSQNGNNFGVFGELNPNGEIGSPHSLAIFYQRFRERNLILSCLMYSIISHALHPIVENA
jgi:hypothetical protein